MNIAIIGCGYVAEFYGATLRNHPQLRLVGVFDRNQQHLQAFSTRWNCRAYASQDALLGDASVALVVNLTNPRSHLAINRACLDAGKHVYCEKPLAMTTDEAVELAAHAAARGLSISAAPCSVLSETAQTLWKSVRDGAIGRVRLVYANFDDGMIAPRESPWRWLNESGVPWPAKDEFEVGCTYEHAGYVLTWLAAMFGPATRMSAFASCQIPDKGIPVDAMAPDFTVGGIQFASGVAARVTCGLVAPRDKSITIVGDDGVLFVGNVRNDGAPVMLRNDRRSPFVSFAGGRLAPLQRWLQERLPVPGMDALLARQVPLVRQPTGLTRADKPVDFCRGIAEQAEAIAAGRPARLSGELAAHIVEMVERLQYPERFEGTPVLRTAFAAMPPMPWAL